MNMRLACVVSAAIICSAFTAQAVPIDEVVPSARYSVSGVGSNRTAIAVKVDSQSRKVLIRYDDNARTEWVSSSRLLRSYEDSFSDDVGETALWGIGAAVLLCALTDGCGDETSSASSTSSSTNGFGIKVTNNCHKEISILIHYKDLSNDWNTKYWWNFDPYETNYLSSEDNKRLKTNNSIMYYYAVGDGYVWEGDAHSVKVGGNTYGLKKFEDSQGDTELTFTCSS
ncbi:hypothetical protein [Henriciella litoralis]|uniref:hypothetical protein n=1 Tax=Henriciella litoralis TaxID=568102 RepID=UPI00111C35EB|nr:hypothetical protein [Henriciella litoralis]